MPAWSNILCVRPYTPARDTVYLASMSLATLPLPDDPTELRDLAVDLQAELARKDIEIAAKARPRSMRKTLHIEKLKMQLAVLRRARFRLLLREARPRDRAA